MIQSTCLKLHESLTENFNLAIFSEFLVGPLSWCSGWGDPHYTSLDGLRYDFQGICSYCFVVTTNKAVKYNLPRFSIEVKLL